MILCTHNIKVFLAKGFVSTPMVSLGTVMQKADLGIIITASHNPPAYNGFKLKGPYGGPLLPSSVAEIELLIPPPLSKINDTSSPLSFGEGPGVRPVTLEDDYIKHVEKNFDLDLIRNSNLHL